MAPFIDSDLQHVTYSQSQQAGSKCNVTWGKDEVPKLSVAINSVLHLLEERLILLIWARGAGNEKFSDTSERLVGQVNI